MVRLRRSNGSKINIYTVKIAKGGLKCAKPCHICVEWMIRYNISKVIYSDHEGKIQVKRLKDVVNDEPYFTKAQRCSVC